MLRIGFGLSLQGARISTGYRSCGKDCRSKAHSHKKKDNLDIYGKKRLLGIYGIVVTERQEKWIGEHMDKMVSF